MKFILSLHRLSFLCEGDGLTLGWVKLHLPVLFPSLETVKISLESSGVILSYLMSQISQYTRQSSANICTVG